MFLFILLLVNWVVGRIFQVREPDVTIRSQSLYWPYPYPLLGTDQILGCRQHCSPLAATLCWDYLEVRQLTSHPCHQLTTPMELQPCLVIIPPASG